LIAADKSHILHDAPSKVAFVYISSIIST